MFTEGDYVELEVEEVFRSYRWSDGRTTRRITVRSSGTYSVEVTDSNGCRGVSGAIAITVRPKDPGGVKHTVKARLVVGRVGAGTGDEFTIPIRVSGAMLARSGVTRPRAELRFNRTLMYPRGATKMGIIDGGDREVQIEIDLDGIGAGDVVAGIEFLAMLGNAERTPVRLEQVELVGGDSSINHRTRGVRADGSVSRGGFSTGECGGGVREQARAAEPCAGDDADRVRSDRKRADGDGAGRYARAEDTEDRRCVTESGAVSSRGGSPGGGLGRVYTVVFGTGGRSSPWTRHAVTVRVVR